MAHFRSYESYKPAAQSGSQESLASSYGSGTIASSDHRIGTATSNSSQTTADTESTAPTSPEHNSVHHHRPLNPPQQTPLRLQTPDHQTHAPAYHDATSPIVTTPVNGHKRMASGQIKSPMVTSPGVATLNAHHRTESVGSNGTKASETAATLKERLAYAMAKVQHGWEHHNIDKVEQLAAAAYSPRATKSPRYADPRDYSTSPRAAGLPTRNIVDQMSAHKIAYNDHHVGPAPLLYPSQTDRSSSGGSMSPPAKRPVAHRTSDAHARSLAPAANLGATPRGHARTDSRNPPSSPDRYLPTTPKAKRPATIRTSTQTAQAEQEAMSALLLMGSPSNSHFPRVNESPRHRAAPRDGLQYRSDSEHSAEGYHSESPRRRLNIMREQARGQIEAES